MNVRGLAYAPYVMSNDVERSRCELSPFLTLFKTASGVGYLLFINMLLLIVIGFDY
jgi:hypothetical protein